MSDVCPDTTQPGRGNWCDCAKLFGTFRFARSWRKISLALAALVLTFLWGSILDRIWVRAGCGAVAGAFETVLLPVETADLPEIDKPADKGVYTEYSAFWRNQVATLLTSVIPTDGFGGAFGTAWSACGNLCGATRLLLRDHTGYCVVFFPGLLIIWAFFGGMICRIAAVEFARGEVITTSEAFAFVRKRFWSGFVLAPLAPLMWIVFCAILLVLGGLFFSIPILGELVGGLLFVLALIAGLAGAVLLVGFTAGGSLLWPTIAVEGTTAFDAFSTSFHYIYTRPWRVALYGIVSFVYGAICWLVVNFFARLTLWFTFTCLNAGTVAERGVYSKLEAVWTFGGLVQPAHHWHPESVSGLDYVAVILIGLWVYLVVGLVWAFLCSFYFSASTVVYYLLRRAVDLTDYERVEEIEDYEQNERPSAEPAPGPAMESVKAESAAQSPSTPAGPPDATEEPPPDNVGSAAGDAPPDTHAAEERDDDPDDHQ